MEPTILRWDPPMPSEPTLAEQLRARPGHWAIVAETNDPGQTIYRLCLDEDEFEVDWSPCDDGLFGVVYEVRVRARNERNQA